MLRQINCLFGGLQGAPGAASWVGTLCHIFFYFGVLDHALKDSRSAHQYIVLLLLGHLVGRGGFLFCAMKVSAVEVDIRCIEINSTGPMIIRALLVDEPGSF